MNAIAMVQARKDDIAGLVGESVTIFEIELTRLVKSLQKGGEGEKGRCQSDSQVSGLSFWVDEWT